MARNITQYSIFLASPGDLEEERIEIENVIKELNITYGAVNNLTIDLIKWESHSAPGITDTYTQDLISSDLGEEYDIFIGLLWQRFGTKTKIADSGTEEEFLNALKRFRDKENIQILFYFKNTPPKFLDQINIEELLKVRQFKNKLQTENVLYGMFNNLDEFKAHLRIHIPKRIESIKKKQKLNQETREENLPKSVLDKSKLDEIILEEDYGLFDYLVSFEKLLEESRKALENITNSTTEVGSEIGLKAEEITRISQQSSPNKFHLLEVLKRVSKIMNNYSERLKTETPIFYENFKEAIEIGLKYLNLMTELNKDDYHANLIATLNASVSLQDSLPVAIEAMSSMHDSVLSIPRLQADINFAKRKLNDSIPELIDKLESAYKLTSEFIKEIESRLVDN